MAGGTSMLCHKGSPDELKPFGDDTMAEQKFDGDRVIAVVKAGKVALLSRTNNNITYRYPEIIEQLRKIKSDVILDGEMIVLINGRDEFNEGISHRRSLKSEEKIKARVITHPATYMAFDILVMNGNEVITKTLTERRKLLQGLFDKEKYDDVIRISQQFTDIQKAWDDAVKNDQEGIIIKNMSSQYSYGRSRNWLKIKYNKDADLVFDSYEENPAGGKLIKTVAHEDDEIEINLEKKPLHVQCAGFNWAPVKARLDSNKSAKIKVQYLGITKDKRLRMPTFKEMLD
ncbi:hypothetical protein LCGC14_0196290 [marine sediment metagenome]|uniref:ATP-dependent DNA ligase family profile domain-containing protein n=1 Tax=marine sediment metagenome TaxID=412755 RepID=A0A0F9X4P9_9ZZZZ